MQRPEGDRFLLTQTELESRIQVLLAGTVAEELVYNDISTGAQNDLQRATEIARSMVMEYGMSRLGRVNYRESPQSAFLSLTTGDDRLRTHSEQTAREIDEEIKRIIDQSIDKVRHILEVRREALNALTQRLIEVESIDAEELERIVDEHSPGPLVVPGTLDAPARLVRSSSAEPIEGGKGAEPKGQRPEARGQKSE
jgi:cell division protease FtsH